MNNGGIHLVVRRFWRAQTGFWSRKSRPQRIRNARMPTLCGADLGGSSPGWTPNSPVWQTISG